MAVMQVPPADHKAGKKKMKPRPGRGGVVAGGAERGRGARALHRGDRRRYGPGLPPGRTRGPQLAQVRGLPPRWPLARAQARRAHRRAAGVRARHGAATGFRLRAKPVRTASGIAVLAVIAVEAASMPAHCDHGEYLFVLSGGPDSDFEYSMQSCSGYKPTSMRAIRASLFLCCRY